MERSIHDSLCVVKRVLESNSVVPGGGAVETALSIYLETFATSIVRLLHSVASVMNSNTHASSASEMNMMDKCVLLILLFSSPLMLYHSCYNDLFLDFSGTAGCGGVCRFSFGHSQDSVSQCSTRFHRSCGQASGFPQCLTDYARER